MIKWIDVTVFILTCYIVIRFSFLTMHLHAMQYSLIVIWFDLEIRILISHISLLQFIVNRNCNWSPASTHSPQIIVIVWPLIDTLLQSARQYPKNMSSTSTYWPRENSHSLRWRPIWHLMMAFKKNNHKKSLTVCPSTRCSITIIDRYYIFATQ